MKRIGNLYDKILDIENIKYVYDKSVRRNTKNKSKIERFEQNYASNLVYIKKILEERKYIPGKYNIFIINEPKIRLIMSQNIIDKVVNHLVSQYFLVNIFDKTLIDGNVATRKGKGNNYGLKKLTKYLQKNVDKDLYILKFDIKKYFFNLDHQIIKKLIRKKIKDPDVLNILDLIIDSTDNPYINKEIKKLKYNFKEKLEMKNISEKEKNKIIKDIDSIPECKLGVSLPIGNLSSQTLAILYLNEMDYYIKEKLKVKFYLRYQDDGVLISEDKNFLKECLKKIEKIIKKYKLEFNNKTRMYKLTSGFEFLGFRFIKIKNKLVIKVKNQTKRKFKRKIKKLYKLYKMNKINFDRIKMIESSYKGHLKNGNTNKLIINTKKMYEYSFYNNFGEKVIILPTGEIKILKIES